MDVPKSFKPEKGLGKKIESLLNSQPKSFQASLELMLKGNKEFLLEGDCTYKRAEEIVRGINYSKYELQSFCNELSYYQKYDGFHWEGLYLSALVNKIINDDGKIMLDLSDIGSKLDCVGAFLKKGMLIINSNAGQWTGYSMKDGELTINGDTEGYAGYDMKGGILRIKGRAKYFTGDKMTGGKIYAKEIDNVSVHYVSGEIYEGKKKIRG